MSDGAHLNRSEQRYRFQQAVTEFIVDDTHYMGNNNRIAFESFDNRFKTRLRRAWKILTGANMFFIGDFIIELDIGRPPSFTSLLIVENPELVFGNLPDGVSDSVCIDSDEYLETLDTDIFIPIDEWPQELKDIVQLKDDHKDV